MDNPTHDIICSLLETSYYRLNETDRKEILLQGRPQPSLDVLKPDKKHGQTYLRSFNVQWYSRYHWLCGSYVKQSLFCWPCVLLSKNRNSVWVLQGFSDFKNLSAGVKKHEVSKEHMSSFLSLKRLERNTTNVRDAWAIQSSLSLKLYNAEVTKNRNLLSYLIDVTCHLAKQELSFGGHNENQDSCNAGNFQETFNLLIKRDIEIQKHLEQIGNIFLSSSETIQNDLVRCISEHVTEVIESEIKNALFFSVQVDDTTDITEKSQCAVSVRYVNKSGEIKERFLGFYDASEDRTATCMYNLISSVLVRFDYENKLVGQCYDGASVMASALNGLQEKIKEDAPMALFTHCSAHRLNLVLQNSLKMIENCRIYFANATSIPGFFHRSAKRTFILDCILHSRIPSSSEIINILDSKWEELKIVFQTIVDDRSSGAESINGATGYLELLNNLEFSFLTATYSKIFDITDILFDILQKKSLDVGYCKERIFLAKDRIQSLRNDLEFNEIFETAERRIYDEPSVKRIKLSDTIKSEEKTSLRILFYEILDNIVTQLELRFADMSQLFYLSLADSQKFKEFSRKFPTQLVTNLVNFYRNIFDQNKLINELQVIYSDDQFEKLNVESIIISFKENNLEDIFPEAFKLFVLVATIPFTSTSVERHFSCSKRIKNYTRNSMKNNRLSPCLPHALALLSIEKDIFTALQQSDDFTDTIINKFSLLRNRPINLIYIK